MRYDILLLDADETLMDFPAAERQALQRTFADHGLTFTQATDDLYQQINQSLCRQFERGEITRPQLLATRFAKLFEELATPGIDTDAFNREYLHNLGYGTQPLPHALELCQALSALGCRLYILTNGLSGPQRRRLAGSGLTPQRHLCLGGDRLPEAAQGVLRLCLCPHPRLCKIARPDGRRLALLGYGRRAQRRSGRLLVQFQRQDRPVRSARSRRPDPLRDSGADGAGGNTRSGMMPRPIRVVGFCLTRLNVLAQVACLWLRSFAETYNRVYKVASRTSLGADCLRVQPANNSRCRLLLGAAQRSRAGRLAG